MADIEGTVNVLMNIRDLNYWLTYLQFYRWEFCWLFTNICTLKNTSSSLKLRHIFFNKTQYRSKICWDMFTIWLKCYEICLFILVGHHTLKSIHLLWFQSTKNPKYWSIFLYSLCQKINRKCYWVNIIDIFIIHYFTNTCMYDSCFELT